jgi:UMF1 family MFS transporter
MSAYPSDAREYQRRIRAWTLYDWANSAFATTILAAVLPIYYSQVAGATLPSEAMATSYWSLTLSVALLVTAVFSPILGTISDLKRRKKRFLAIFVGVGILGTGALVAVGTGDWLLASMLMIVARIGFTGANTFYDALLPHVAREEDRDAVSTRGYAMGYLGGGLLLAINVVMIFQLGFEAGARLSFISVAVWWALFSIPLFRQVPEPPAATDTARPGLNVVAASFQRIWETIRDVSRYRELFKFLIAFLIYNDAIGTIIGVAAIYGTELGFSATELILALLLVQFVGIPFSLIFGWLPSQQQTRRPFFLAFILFNLAVLPLVGIAGAQLLPQNLTGVLLPPYETVGDARGSGVYSADSGAFQFEGDWDMTLVSAATLGTDQAQAYQLTGDPNAALVFSFHGEQVTVTYSAGPDHGAWQPLIDGEPVLVESDSGDMVPLIIDSYSPVARYGLHVTLSAEPGIHTLTIISVSETGQGNAGLVIGIGGIEVLAPVSASSLPTIMGLLLAVQAVGLIFSALIGRHLVRQLAAALNTQRSILLALIIYGVIAVWGFVLRSTVEFWFLAWMVAIVQGGSQALSRSLYAALSPAAKSGEFFGLFGVMEKFSSFLGPLIFALAAATFGSSRPAILALIVFFVVGGWLLMRVDVEAGRRLAQAEDAALL